MTPLAQAGLPAVAVYRSGRWLTRPPPPLRYTCVTYYLAYGWVRDVYGIDLPLQAVVGRRWRIAHQGGCPDVPEGGRAVGQVAQLREPGGSSERGSGAARDRAG